MADTPNWLYHYTGSDAFLRIVDSGVIWATDLVYSNDSSEISYAISLAYEIAHTRLGRTYGQLRDNLESIRMSWDLTPGSRVFVVSLSEKSDDLNQWRSYCPPNLGVAIAFEVTKLTSIAQKQGFQFQRVIYDREEQIELLKPVVKKLRVTRSDGNMPDKTYSEFLFAASSMKHPSFSEEREWRLVSRPVPVDDTRIMFRQGRICILPYIGIKLIEDGRLASIVRIVVGPSQIARPGTEHSLATSAMLQFLMSMRSSGRVMSQIASSKVPFRY